MDALDADSRQIAFEQFARNFARALTMTPVGWLVVLALAWNYAPARSLWLWFLGALACWLLSVTLCRRARRSGFDLSTHRRALGAAAFVDGFGWGLLGVFLMGLDATLDARLVAVLCGVVAVTVGVYITSLPGMRLQLAGTWTGLLGSLVIGGGPDGAMLFGLAVMHVLMLAFLPAIHERVMDGIRLQQANARLAEQLRLHLQTVEEEAATDPLTGVLNRRAFDRLLARETERCEAHGTVVSVLALDLDHFKAINDTHGHAVGDEALRAFARRIRGQLRQSDHLARLGGEEFIVLLPGAPREKAHEIAERLRACVADAPLVEAPQVAATVSIGVAAFCAGECAADLLARADTAAYAAKRAGRDRVVLAEP